MSELFGVHGLVVALVALLVIGPKDLPKAMRVVGYWVGKARGVSRQFRQGFDAMVREAEVEEMEKKWAAENERIMREHPSSAHDAVTTDDAVSAPSTSGGSARAAREDEGVGQPMMVEKPVLEPSASDTAAPKSDGAPS